jgi:hypothetical protein
MLVIAVVFICSISIDAFAFNNMRSMRTPTRSLQAEKKEQQDERVFRVEVPMGEGYQNVLTNFRPIFEKSTIFVTTYEIPFSLNVEKPPPGINA